VRYQKALAASAAPTLSAAAFIKVVAARSARRVELETLSLGTWENVLMVRQERKPTVSGEQTSRFHCPRSGCTTQEIII